MSEPIQAVRKKEIFVYIMLAMWLCFWVNLVIKTFERNKVYYQFAFGAPLEKLRSFHASFDPDSADFYRILKYCDRQLPPGEDIQLVLPTDNNFKYLFLRDKARYFLYPRNYGDNLTKKNYILVFQNKDFKVTDDYHVLAKFSDDKYLLRKTSDTSRNELK